MNVPAATRNWNILDGSPAKARKALKQLTNRKGRRQVRQDLAQGKEVPLTRLRIDTYMIA